MEYARIDSLIIIIIKDVEQRYSQTEREAVAAPWACEHFHYFLFDRHFTICTDHLTKLYSASSSPPPRIQRWLLCVQTYDYESYMNPSKQPDGCNVTQTTANNKHR